MHGFHRPQACAMEIQYDTLVEDNSSFSLNHNLITLKALTRWDLRDEDTDTCRWNRDKTIVQIANAWPSLFQGSGSIYETGESRSQPGRQRGQWVTARETEGTAGRRSLERRSGGSRRS